MNNAIVQVTRFLYMGKEYKSLKEIKTEIENQLGAIIDSLPDRLPTKQRLQIHDLLINRRSDLVRLLSTELAGDERNGESNENIFDK